MLAQRLLWAGGVIGSGLTTYFAYVQVENQLARWSFCLIGVLFLIMSLVMFPWGQNEDGTPRRIFNYNVRGKNNPATHITGDSATVTGPIVTGNVKKLIYMSPPQAAEISNNAGRAEVLPDTKFIPDAETKDSVVAVLDARFGELTDKLLANINERDPQLYGRFADPRFLAPLASAHRAYAETGSEELSDTLAGLLTDLAGQPIRSRKELILRQALDAAPRLTAAHMNSLAVFAHFTEMQLAIAFGPEDVISKFDDLLKPYYGAILSSNIDYNYMSSVGVCDSDVLGSFSSGPFKVLYDRNINFMYSPFTLQEVNDKLFGESTDDEDDQQVFNILMQTVPATPDDVVAHETRFLIKKEGARFRIARDQVQQVLGNSHTVKQKLTEPQKKLRAMVEERLLSSVDFEAEVRKDAPEMARFFDQLKRCGGLNIRINAVGLMLAQHVMRSNNPHVADVIGSKFDDDEDTNRAAE